MGQVYGTINLNEDPAGGGRRGGEEQTKRQIRKEGEGEEVFTPIDGHSDRKRDERERLSRWGTQKCPVGCGVDTAWDSLYRSRTYNICQALRLRCQNSPLLNETMVQCSIKCLLDLQQGCSTAGPAATRHGRGGRGRQGGQGKGENQKQIAKAGKVNQKSSSHNQNLNFSHCYLPLRPASSGQAIWRSRVSVSVQIARTVI